MCQTRHQHVCVGLVTGMHLSFWESSLGEAAKLKDIFKAFHCVVGYRLPALSDMIWQNL